MAKETLVFDLSSAAGMKWEFCPEGGDWTTIQVPCGGWRAQGHKCDAGVYRLHLPVPALAKGQSVQLYFEAINWGSEVFVGRDEASLVRVASHLAPWVPVMVDLSGQVQAGPVQAGQECLLVVKVKGRNKYQHEHAAMQWDYSSGFKPQTAKRWMVPQAAAWLEDIAEGIIRGVRMLIVPAVHLSEPFVVTSVSQGTLNAYVKVNNVSDKPVKGIIRAKLSSACAAKFAYAKLPEVAFSVDARDSRRFDLLTTIWGLDKNSFWWPNVPYQKGYQAVLHNLELEVVVDGKVTHTLRQRFGFREFSWKGSYYYLNGVRCNLRGDNQQEANFGTDAYGVHPGFGMPRKGNAGWPGAVDTLLRMNFNVLRIHQVPATPYMLDVCDELGLMIVDESPVRNSECLEDWVGGWENMIAVVRELVLRDRNHASVVIWSAANEIWNNRPLSLALQGAVWSADWTRPVIIDGVGDVGQEIINMNHYVGGCGTFPEQGGEKREDRPYGETESIWPMDNSLKGFAWMATSTRHRRLRNNADIRNYVLNNAFPNYVPGQGRDQQLLEKKVKDIRWEQVTSDMEILADIKNPWTNANVVLMQQCYHPCAACDVQFDRENRLSNEQGAWPAVKPKLPAGAQVQRTIAVFNDTFAGELLTLNWALHGGGKRLAGGSQELIIPLGSYVQLPIAFQTPGAKGEVRLSLEVHKNRKVLFREEGMLFEVG